MKVCIAVNVDLFSLKLFSAWEKKIEFIKKIYNSIIHQCFKNFLKSRQNQNWPIIFNILFLSLFKNRSYFWDFHLIWEDTRA
jgi:hypothetical protein